jgi:hypothetical protein
MIGIYDQDELLAIYTNLYAYAIAETDRRVRNGSRLSKKLNSVYVAAYHTLKNPGRTTYSQIYGGHIHVRNLDRKIPTPNKTI